MRSAYVEGNLDTSVFDDLVIKRIIRDTKRVYDKGAKKLRLSLIASILYKVINEASDDFDNINIKAALCVAFAGFLRSGEFTWDTSSIALLRRHAIFNRDGSVTVTLPSSKTDPFKHGVAIELAASPASPLCPVSALRRLYSRFPRDPSHPLFSRVIGSFNRQYLIDRVKELLLRAGISTTGFSCHSLRKGAAVSAAVNGISRKEIKVLGRWKNDAADVYINELSASEHTQKLLQLNRKLHTSFTPPKLVASLASSA